MIHLSSFRSVRYRGIDGLNIPRLTKANLVTGVNGVGKTALLEAIWLFTGRYNPSLLWNANVQRSVRPHIDPISRLTNNKLSLFGVEHKEDHSVEDHSVEYSFEKINGTIADARVVHPLQEDIAHLPPVVGIIRTHLDDKLVKEGPGGLHNTPTGVVLYVSANEATGRPNCVIESTRFQNEVTVEYLQRYSDLVREGQKSEMVTAMKMISERIEDMEILTDDSKEPYLSVTMRSGKLQSIHDLGGGAVRLARLLLGFSGSRHGIFLSDELENGIHYSAHSAIWDKVKEWISQWNVQFVATTHSGELVDAAIGAFADRADDLSIHQLFRNKNTGQVEVATYSGESLLGARDLNLEVR